MICCLDATVFPANASYMSNAIKTFSALLSMTSNAVGIVLMPVYQTQTTPGALLKHKHLLETNLMNAGLSTHHTIQVLFAKPDSSAKDARALCQTAIACFHTHFSEHAFTSSVAIREGKLGPCNLAKISDFIGYDGELSKPGAAARVEQLLRFGPVLHLLMKTA